MQWAVWTWVGLIIVVFLFVLGFRYWGPPRPYYWRRRHEQLHGGGNAIRWGWWADIAWLAFVALIALIIVAYIR